jgi:predicted nuclease with TOPRIM domain
MTNEQFQKELKEKVKEGIKPSDLKKLKKSKSEGDLKPWTPPDFLLTDQLKEKQKEIESLRQKLEGKNAELSELKKPISPSEDEVSAYKHSLSGGE